MLDLVVMSIEYQINVNMAAITSRTCLLRFCGGLTQFWLWPVGDGLDGHADKTATYEHRNRIMGCFPRAIPVRGKARQEARTRRLRIVLDPPAELQLELASPPPRPKNRTPLLTAWLLRPSYQSPRGPIESCLSEAGLAVCPILARSAHAECNRAVPHMAWPPLTGCYTHSGRPG